MMRKLRCVLCDVYLELVMPRSICQVPYKFWNAAILGYELTRAAVEYLVYGPTEATHDLHYTLANQLFKSYEGCYASDPYPAPVQPGQAIRLRQACQAYPFTQTVAADSTQSSPKGGREGDDLRKLLPPWPQDKPFQGYELLPEWIIPDALWSLCSEENASESGTKDANRHRSAALPSLVLDTLRPLYPREQIIMFVHGGAYVALSPRTHRMLTGSLAQVTGRRVLSVDYRLAPDFPFPCGLYDVLVTYLKLLGPNAPSACEPSQVSEATSGDTSDNLPNRSGYYFHPKDIILAGDSAGGGLVAALLMVLRDANLPQPRGAVLLAPWINPFCNTPTWTLYRNTDLDLGPLGSTLHPTVMYAGPTLTIAQALDAARHPLIYLLDADWSRLPPMLIQGGEAESMYGDFLQLKDRMAKASQDQHKLEFYKGMGHVFQTLAAMDIPDAYRALHLCGPRTNGNPLQIYELRQLIAEELCLRDRLALTLASKGTRVGNDLLPQTKRFHILYDMYTKGKMQSQDQAKFVYFVQNYEQAARDILHPYLNTYSGFIGSAFNCANIVPFDATVYTHRRTHPFLDMMTRNTDANHDALFQRLVEALVHNTSTLTELLFSRDFQDLSPISPLAYHVAMLNFLRDLMSQAIIRNQHQHIAWLKQLYKSYLEFWLEWSSKLNPVTLISSQTDGMDSATEMASYRRIKSAPLTLTSAETYPSTSAAYLCMLSMWAFKLDHTALGPSLCQAEDLHAPQAAVLRNLACALDVILLEDIVAPILEEATWPEVSGRLHDNLHDSVIYTPSASHSFDPDHLTWLLINPEAPAGLAGATSLG
ncbi:hypothetical protein H4R34_001813 [Dimargaris verticillata]|uniref:Alpha/beta hydrolase fold-3 domain-containing protein n=1 Tax=Dimargaris verticillata TaxID=2761393 RepID=A0A9W8B2X1_9FUNG|nr:hypothetical protein H4R34_001813 [Dimargaris verticillata]